MPPAALTKVASGTPFAHVAAAAGTGSGPQGCDIFYGIASQLPAGTNLQTLADNHGLERRSPLTGATS